MPNPIARIEAPLKHQEYHRFLVYIPPKDQTPLQIEPRPGRTLSDIFFVPSFGGVLFLNKDYDSTDDELSVEDYQNIAESIVTQIRLLLGLPESPRLSSALRRPDRGIAEYEVHSLRLQKFLDDSRWTIQALSALSKIREKIPNIEISNDVQEKAIAHSSLPSNHFS